MRAAMLATVAAVALTGAAQADQKFEATLAGHAILPAASFVAAPEAAGPGFAVSGKFAGPGNSRVTVPGSIAGASGSGAAARPTGLSFPFRGQPLQGFSGITPVGDGSYWVLTDNGFGSKRNSPDALLMFHRVRPDWASGRVVVERTIFLSDPSRVLPFNIVTDATDARYLTGADFDIESIQPVGDGFWFGDEFGPYLFRTDGEGRVTHFFDTTLDGKTLRSPDNHALQVPASPTGAVAYEVSRSGGYEGMAATPDGARLYAMLEKPLFAAGGDQAEGRYLRVLEFDTRKPGWTGRSLKYRLEDGATAIGDFNMIDGSRALVIERDNGEGDPSLACAQGQTPPACFPSPAKFKRVYLVDLAQADGDGFVRKIGHIDLMAIRDPRGVARQRGDLGDVGKATFGFPFFTIEDVAMVDADHIIVGNDNNLPFSAGRDLARADDNELILLHVPDLLRAR
ncbi:MAG: esterase-like activity of phytase family protein [Alphaproteobacteria bacterium]